MPWTDLPAAIAAVAVTVVLLLPAPLSAQVSQPAAPITTTPAKDPNELKVSIYPVLVWVPTFKADANVPPFPDFPGGPDLPGGSGSTPASLDGAFLAGFSLEQSRWRLDVEGIWAALTTTRDRPLLNVDLDIIYGRVSGGVKVYKDLYVTGGLRRVALDYDITLGERPTFSRKPGVWDPLVGLGWHGALGPKWELHVLGEGGGFGVGADVDLSAAVRADWKIVSHFGLTFGYTALYLKISDTVAQRTLTVKQTLQGPVAGIGLYF